MIHSLHVQLEMHSFYAGGNALASFYALLSRVPTCQRSSLKFIQPGRKLSDTSSLVWREGQSALMASTRGAKESLVIMALALDAAAEIWGLFLSAERCQESWWPLIPQERGCWLGDREDPCEQVQTRYSQIEAGGPEILRMPELGKALLMIKYWNSETIYRAFTHAKNFACIISFNSYNPGK